VKDNILDTLLGIFEMYYQHNNTLSLEAPAEDKVRWAVNRKIITHEEAEQALAYLHQQQRIFGLRK